MNEHLKNLRSIYVDAVENEKLAHELEKELFRMAEEGQGQLTEAQIKATKDEELTKTLKMSIKHEKEKKHGTHSIER